MRIPRVIGHYRKLPLRLHGGTFAGLCAVHQSWDNFRVRRDSGATRFLVRAELYTYPGTAGVRRHAEEVVKDEATIRQTGYVTRRDSIAGTLLLGTAGSSSPPNLASAALV